jgi:hypothetical protein
MQPIVRPKVLDRKLLHIGLSRPMRRRHAPASRDCIQAANGYRG